MAYVTPKVTWKSSDSFETTDWNRIRNNLLWIYDWMVARKMAPTPLQSTTLPNAGNSLPYVDLINKMEANLQAVNDSFGIDYTAWDGRKTWYARLDALWTENPTNEDWNRWELLAKLIRESIDYIENYLYQRVSATFCAGEFRTVQHFSRGRTF